MATEQSTYRATNDAYTGMLAISLIALIVGSSLLFLDYQQYPEASPKPVPKKALEAIKPEAPPEKPPETTKDDDKKGEPKADEKKE